MLQSDKAKLVECWVESTLLISKPPLDRKHFDRETRQNLKKMRPCAAHSVLELIADQSWEGVPDVTREVHRMVSHAKADDKYAHCKTAASTLPAMSLQMSIAGLR
jgi:hypothetical protein